MKLIKRIKNSIAVFRNNRRICIEDVHTSFGDVKIPLEKNLLIFSTVIGVRETEKILSFNIKIQLSSRKVIFGGEVSGMECDELIDITKAMTINRQAKKYYINWITFTINPDCNSKHIWEGFYAENCAFLFDLSASTDIPTIKAWKNMFGHLPGPTPYDIEKPGQFLVYVAGHKHVLMGEIKRSEYQNLIQVPEEISIFENRG
jgi:hypothetical protein